MPVCHKCKQIRASADMRRTRKVLPNFVQAWKCKGPCPKTVVERIKEHTDGRPH